MSEVKQLDSKLLAVIEKIDCGQRISALKDSSIQYITNNFEEPYVRLLILKANAPADQQIIFEKIRNAYNNTHVIGEDGYDLIYEEAPSYFTELQTYLDLALPIDSPLPSSLSKLSLDNIDPSLQQWVQAEGAMTQSLNTALDQLSGVIQTLTSETPARLKQIRNLDISAVSTLTHQLDEAVKKINDQQNQIEALKQENANLKLVNRPQVARPLTSPPNTITVNQIREGILNMADNFSEIGAYVHHIQNLNQTLGNTVWAVFANSALIDARNFYLSKQKPLVTFSPTIGQLNMRDGYQSNTPFPQPHSCPKPKNYMPIPPSNNNKPPF